MPENVAYLHRQPEPIAHYLRLGSFHRQVEKLLAAGRLPVGRVVVEAVAFTHQKDVVGQLVDTGCELMLDATVGDGPHAHAPPRRGNGAVDARGARR
jgi:hypothetical protein